MFNHQDLVKDFRGDRSLFQLVTNSISTGRREVVKVHPRQRGAANKNYKESMKNKKEQDRIRAELDKLVLVAHMSLEGQELEEFLQGLWDVYEKLGVLTNV